MDNDCKIFLEDTHIIVCEKPPGVPSQGDRTNDYDMVSRLKNYLYKKNPKGGEPYISIVHRLDRPVGGIMVFAKTREAAGGLSKAIKEGKVKKYYLAVADYDGTQSLGREPMKLTDYVAKDGRTNLSRISDVNDPNAKKAELYYKVLKVKEGCSLLEIELLTGRHHQIRVQLAEHLGGLYGDTKYNPKLKEMKGWVQIGLYSYCIKFQHPISKKPICVRNFPQSEPFASFQEICE